jgi:hypothetical protein
LQPFFYRNSGPIELALWKTEKPNYCFFILEGSDSLRGSGDFPSQFHGQPSFDSLASVEPEPALEKGRAEKPTALIPVRIFLAPASPAGAQAESTDGKNSPIHLGSTDPKIKTQGGKKIMKQKVLALLAGAVLLLTLAAGCGGSGGGTSSGGGGTTSGNVSASAE